MFSIYQKNRLDGKSLLAVWRSGFTLMELLVVVLILGVMAAAALPQYQKAVAKARLAEGLAVGKSIVQAEYVHKMATGDYTADLEELALSLPSGGEISQGEDSLIIWYPRKRIRYVIERAGGWRLDFYTDDVVVQRVFDWEDDQCVIRTEIGKYLCQSLGADVSGEGTVKIIPKL